MSEGVRKWGKEREERMKGGGREREGEREGEREKERERERERGRKEGREGERHMTT